jgi:formylglycine-generating enzyme required for sulfatase activity
MEKRISATGAKTSRSHVIRGGGFRNTARWCLAAFRFGRHPDVRSVNLGFRPVAEVTDTSEEEKGRVIRGGSWVSFAWSCRSASRYGDVPGCRYGSLGFRPVAEVKW